MHKIQNIVQSNSTQYTRNALKPCNIQKRLLRKTQKWAKIEFLKNFSIHQSL